MIKTGGINVAPLEIENILMRYPKKNRHLYLESQMQLKTKKLSQF